MELLKSELSQIAEAIRSVGSDLPEELQGKDLDQLNQTIADRERSAEKKKEEVEELKAQIGSLKTEHESLKVEYEARISKEIMEKKLKNSVMLDKIKRLTSSASASGGSSETSSFFQDMENQISERRRSLAAEKRAWRKQLAEKQASLERLFSENAALGAICGELSESLRLAKSYHSESENSAMGEIEKLRARTKELRAELAGKIDRERSLLLEAVDLRMQARSKPKHKKAGSIEEAREELEDSAELRSQKEEECVRRLGDVNAKILVGEVQKERIISGLCFNRITKEEELARDLDLDLDLDPQHHHHHHHHTKNPQQEPLSVLKRFSAFSEPELSAEIETQKEELSRECLKEKKLKALLQGLNKKKTKNESVEI